MSTKQIPFIDLETQQKRIRANVDARIAKVLDHGQYIMGPEIAEFEKSAAAYVGAKHCVSVANGTDALLIAMLGLDIKPGDEVITSPFTFVANAEMMALAGIKPVFVDIDERTYNMDPKLVAKAITKKTKAIMPVSLYGQCAEIDEIAKQCDFPIIEDAAQSFGAEYKGRKSCGLSAIGCTSFFPSKPLGAYGDAGACFTSDDEIAKKMGWIRTHGQDRRYHHAIVGMNGRMDTMQAAILLAKMEIFAEECAERTRIGARYSELLKGKVVTPFVAAGHRSVYAQYTIQISNRTELQEHLKQKGIPTAVHYPIPIHMQPAFQYLGLKKGDFPNSERAAERVMSLPMHPYLSENDIQFIAGAVMEAAKQ